MQMVPDLDEEHVNGTTHGIRVLKALNRLSGDDMARRE